MAMSLLQAHRLRVVLDADDMAFRDTTAHEYNLDDIKVSHAAELARLMPESNSSACPSSHMLAP